MRIFDALLGRRRRAVGERRVDRQRGADQAHAALLGGLDERRRELELDLLDLAGGDADAGEARDRLGRSPPSCERRVARSDVETTTCRRACRRRPSGSGPGSTSCSSRCPRSTTVSVVLAFGANVAPVGGAGRKPANDTACRPGRPSASPRRWRSPAGTRRTGGRGRKVTWVSQLAPGESVAPAQALAVIANGPPAAIAPTCRSPVPLLVSVTARAARGADRDGAEVERAGRRPWQRGP